MKRIQIIGAATLAITLLAWSAISASNSGKGPGALYAGSYYLKVHHDGFPAIPALANLDRDGGFIASDASDFGAAGTTLNTPVYGSWKHLGNREIAVRTYYIGFDDAGEPIAVTRTTGFFEFDKDLQTGHGEMHIELFDVEQDPLDPDAIPFATLDARASAHRITVPE